MLSVLNGIECTPSAFSKRVKLFTRFREHKQCVQCCQARGDVGQSVATASCWWSRPSTSIQDDQSAPRIVNRLAEKIRLVLTFKDYLIERN